MNADLGDLIRGFESDSGPKIKRYSVFMLFFGIAVMIFAAALGDFLRDDEIAAFFTVLGILCIIIGVVGMIIHSRKAQLEIRTNGILITRGQNCFSLLYEEMQMPEIVSAFMLTQVFFKNIYNASNKFIVRDAEMANEICQIISQARDERLAQL